LETSHDISWDNSDPSAGRNIPNHFVFSESDLSLEGGVKDSDLNKFLIPLLAVFAIYLPLSYTAPSPGQQSSGQPQSQETVQSPPTVEPPPKPAPGRVSGEAAKLLCDFFGLARDLGQNGGLNTQQKSDFENWRGDYCKIKSALNSKASKRVSPSGYDKIKIEYLIATVPDPKDTRLDHEFDLVLEAIQRAIGSAEYTLDRYWLPWERSQTAPPAISPADPKTAQIATRYLREPGVILFRDSIENRLLLLFLVGETPTGGIYGVAFQNALRQIEELPHWVGSSTEEHAEEKELRILGPYFSGSADSLAMALNAWIHEQTQRPRTRVITGSVGSIDKDDFLKKIAAPEGVLPEVTFYATVVPTRQVNRVFYEYLMGRDQKIKPYDDGNPTRAHIAVLAEESTRRGQNIRRAIRVQNEEATSGYLEKQAPPSACAPLPPPPQPPPRLLSLTYPLHIAQLRMEAAKIPSRNGAAKALEFKEPNLPLPMSEAGSPASADVLPVFSSLEPATMELALRKTLNAIHREPIRYVKVSATDPQDHLFLVREIHKHCPNAIIFMQSGDLLYLHSDHYLNYRGALVISSYPLFGLNQLWTYPFQGDQRRLQFSTTNAQGLYNATLALLNREDRVLEYGYPFKQYKDGQVRYPALWLSIVGLNDIWPVKTFKSEFPSEDCYTLPVTVKSPSSSGREKGAPRLGLSGKYVSPTGAVPLLLIGLICVALSLSLLSLRHCAWSRRRWLGRVFGDEEFYRYRLDRRIYLYCCCASLLTVSLFISGVVLLPGWIYKTFDPKDGDVLQKGWDRYWVNGAVALIIFALTLIAFTWLAVSIVRWMPNGWRHFRGHIWVVPELVIAAVMITLIIVGLGEVFFRFEMPEEVFFFLRTTELTNGISILPPGLLVALTAFLLFFLAVRRLNLAEQMSFMLKPRQRPDVAPQLLRFDDKRAKSFEGLRLLEDRVKETIISPNFRVPGAALVIPLFFINLFFFQANFIPSVEGPWFDWFFKLAFCFVPLMLVLALLRLIWLWVSAKRLLRSLWCHPLISQYAVKHFKEDRFKLLPRVNLMTMPTYDSLSSSVRQARSFYNAWKPRVKRDKAGEIKQLVEVAENKLSLELDSEARGDWQGALRYHLDTEATLAELTERVTGLLENSWERANDAEPDARWHDAGKFFLITYIAAFLQHILAQMQNLVRLITVGLVLLLFATISYPFQPRGQLLLLSWVTILTSVVVMLLIFIDVSRNETLSLLSGTEPGKVTFTTDLVFRALINGVVPILALLGAQFPEAVRQIISWLSVFEGKKS
jgi:hypothetical protein